MLVGILLFKFSPVVARGGNCFTPHDAFIAGENIGCPFVIPLGSDGRFKGHGDVLGEKRNNLPGFEIKAFIVSSSRITGHFLENISSDVPARIEGDFAEGTEAFGPVLIKRCGLVDDLALAVASMEPAIFEKSNTENDGVVMRTTVGFAVLAAVKISERSPAAFSKSLKELLEIAFDERAA